MRVLILVVVAHYKIAEGKGKKEFKHREEVGEGVRGNARWLTGQV